MTPEQHETENFRRTRETQIIFIAAFVLAAAAWGGTLYLCAETRASVRGRLEERIPGPRLSAERAENHLAWVAYRGRLSVGIVAATWLV